MKNENEKELKVICELNENPEIYKYPMIIKYNPECFIISTAAKDYITDYQKIFKKYVKLSIEKKIKPIEKELNKMVIRYREEGKLYFSNEIDFTPQGKFPQRLVNNQIAILPGMIRLKNTEFIKEEYPIPIIPPIIVPIGKKIEKKVNIKKGCKNC